jgi:hypothetical protein
MNRLLKIALATAAVSALAAPAFAQSSDLVSTTGTTRIMQPISIEKDNDLAFGSVVKPTSGTNTITVPVDSDDAEISGGGNGALAASATGNADFTVTGEGGSTYSISTPATFNMTRVSGSETLTVTLAASDPTGTLSNAAGAEGTDTFTVGGSFDVASTTVIGSYTGSFNVTVAYN